VLAGVTTRDVVPVTLTGPGVIVNEVAPLAFQERVELDPADTLFAEAVKEEMLGG
jgi:hypothetical protein